MSFVKDMICGFVHSFTFPENSVNSLVKCLKYFSKRSVTVENHNQHKQYLFKLMHVDPLIGLLYGLLYGHKS